MAHLLDLPPELLHAISKALLPDSIASFVLTCKTIYARSSATIKQHNAYRSQWRDATPRGPRRNDILNTLHAIARDPLIALYVEKLSLWDRRSPEEISSSALCDTRKSEEKMTRIREMVVGCEMIREAGLDAEEVWDEVVDENARFGSRADMWDMDSDYFESHYYLNTSIVMLLLFLPNVRELGLPYFWSGFEGAAHSAGVFPQKTKAYTLLTHAVEKARARNAEATPMCADAAPLAKLETLLPYRTEGGENKTDLNAIEPFLPLPILRNLYSVSGVTIPSDGLDFTWQPQNAILTMSLRRLELMCGCLDADGIRAILSRTPHLEVFKYELECKSDSTGGLIEVRPFFSALAECVGATLRELAVFASAAAVCVEEEASDLKAFAKLEVVEIDIGLFDLANSRLEDILPTTVKRVRIHISGDSAFCSQCDEGHGMYSALKNLQIGRCRGGEFQDMEHVVVQAECCREPGFYTQYADTILR